MSFIFLCNLLIEVKSGAILPLRPLDSNTACWHLGATDTVVGCAQQRDCDPTMNVYMCLEVVMIPPGH